MTRSTLWQPGQQAAFLVLAGLLGCTSLRQQPLAAGELARLDGDYQNTNRTAFYTLANVLVSRRKLGARLPQGVGTHDSLLHLTVRAVSGRAIRAQVFYRLTLLTEAVRQGRVRQGRLLLKPLVDFRGIPGLRYGFNVMRGQLSLSGTDTLLLDANHYGLTFMVAMPVGGVDQKERQVPLAKWR